MYFVIPSILPQFINFTPVVLLAYNNGPSLSQIINITLLNLRLDAQNSATNPQCEPAYLCTLLPYRSKVKHVPDDATTLEELRSIHYQKGLPVASLPPSDSAWDNHIRRCHSGLHLEPGPYTITHYAKTR